MLHNFDSK